MRVNEINSNHKQKTNFKAIKVKLETPLNSKLVSDIIITKNNRVKGYYTGQDWFGNFSLFIMTKNGTEKEKTLFAELQNSTHVPKNVSIVDEELAKTEISRNVENLFHKIKYIED